MSGVEHQQSTYSYKGDYVELTMRTFRSGMHAFVHADVTNKECSPADRLNSVTVWKEEGDGVVSCHPILAYKWDMWRHIVQQAEQGKFRAASKDAIGRAVVKKIEALLPKLRPRIEAWESYLSTLGCDIKCPFCKRAMGAIREGKSITPVALLSIRLNTEQASYLVRASQCPSYVKTDGQYMFACFNPKCAYMPAFSHAEMTAAITQYLHEHYKQTDNQ